MYEEERGPWFDDDINIEDYPAQPEPEGPIYPDSAAEDWTPTLPPYVPGRDGPPPFISTPNPNPIPLPPSFNTGGTQQTSSGQYWPGIPKEWQDDFIRRNPGDWSRIPSAYGSDNISKTNVPGQPAGAMAGGFQWPTASQAVNYSQNPALQELIEQMIANQKMYAQQQASQFEQQNQWRNQMRTNIMDRYNAASQPVTEHDPNIQYHRQVFDAESQRAVNRSREAFAARNATTGTPQGASDAFLQSSYENLGQANASNTSQLMSEELRARRQEIAQMLSLGAGVLNADENRLLQERLGTIDAELGRLGLQTDAFLRGTGLDQNYNLGLMGINNQNTQFYDRLGYDIGLQEAMMNQMIFNQLMGM